MVVHGRPKTPELADDTTALLIYWRMWWRGTLPRQYPLVDFLRSDSAKRHILGCGGPRGGAYVPKWPPKFELGRDFYAVHLSAKFRHPTFNRSKAIVLTSKQTNWQANTQTQLKTSTSLRYATPVGNKYRIIESTEALFMWDCQLPYLHDQSYNSSKALCMYT